MPLNLAPYGKYGRSLLGDPSIPSHLWQYQPTETAHDPNPPLTLASGGPAIVTMAATTLTGVGALSASSVVVVIASATGLAGTGALAASPIVIVIGAATGLAGVGALSASPVVVVPASTTELAGAGALAATGAVIVVAAATGLTGTGALTATSQVQVFAAATEIAGTGTLTASTQVVVIAAATEVAGAGTLSATGIVIVVGSGILAGVGSLTGLGDVIEVATPAAPSGGSSHEIITRPPRIEEVARPKFVVASPTSMPAQTSLTSSAIIIVLGIGAEFAGRAGQFAEARRVVVVTATLRGVTAGYATGRVEYTADNEIEALLLGIAEPELAGVL